MNSVVHKKIDKAMTTEQFTQVVDAILEGKYSWACVLILRFAGYNPLHYIPYRTYNRLMKDNSQDYQRHSCDTKSFQNQQITEQNFQKKPHRIQDLSYLEPLNSSQHRIDGGFSSHFEACSYLEHLKLMR